LSVSLGVFRAPSFGIIARSGEDICLSAIDAVSGY
jgi:hypothetical protein